MATVTIAAANAATGDPLNDVQIRVYSGATLVTTGVTGEAANADGERIFDLAAGAYTMRLAYASPGYVVSSPQSFTVVGSGDTFDVEVELPTLPVATSAAHCRCSGYIVDPSGAAVRGATYGLVLVEGPRIISAAGVTPRKLQVTTNDAGYASVDLIRGALYQVEYDADEPMEDYIRVPALSAANLADVLHPLVASVTFSPSSLSLDVDEEGDVAVTVRYRSGLAVDLADYDADSTPVVFEAADDEVTLRVVDGVLKVTGSAAGSYTVTVARSAPEFSGDILYGQSELSSTLSVTVA